MADLLLRGADTNLTMDDTRRGLTGADIWIRGRVIAVVGHDLPAQGQR